MSLLFFFVPLHRPEPAASELNAALAAGRVLRLERHFVETGPEPGWAFCLERAEGPGPLPAGLKAAAADKGKGGSVDYKQVLSEADFAAFAALRELRKQLAQAEGVPVYAVFSNEQLAAMVTQRVASRSAPMAPANLPPRMPVVKSPRVRERCGPARAARRLVEQPPRQRALGLPQPQAPRQAQPQQRLSSCPELVRCVPNGRSEPRGVARDQTRRPALPRPVPRRANRQGPGVPVGQASGPRRTPPGCSVAQELAHVAA